jgi:uncharacterized protein (TIGR03435 family)
MMRIILVFAILLSVACAQTAFEVASVKPSDPAGRRNSFRVYPGGRLEVTNIPLEAIIGFAYGVRLREQLSGGPNWIHDTNFDIDARTGEGDPDRGQVMAMLRTLLADRFQLQIHKEVREGNGYALVVAKAGPKLKASEAESSMWAKQSHGTAEQPGRSYSFIAKRTSTATLAEKLANSFGVPVTDRTDLTGVYDFKIDFEVDETGDSTGSLISALPEQIGLKLQSAKVPFEHLIVDKVARPAGN